LNERFGEVCRDVAIAMLQEQGLGGARTKRFTAPASDRFVRSAALHPPKMLHDARMAGLVKLRRSTGHLGERQVRAGCVLKGDLSLQFCTGNSLQHSRHLPAADQCVLPDWNCQMTAASPKRSYPEELSSN